MSKNSIHNFNLSIKNSADIKSSEDLTKTIIKELAKVSKEMSEQKDIVQEWQEQKNQNATTIANNSSTLSEEGAINTSDETIKLISNTSSDFEGKTSSLNGLTSSALIEGGVTDNIGRATTISSTSVNITPSNLGVENNTLNFSRGTTSQTYASVVSQQNITVPQILQKNSVEPTLEVIKAAIKKKLDDAGKANDSIGIEYWTSISKAFDEGATAQDFDDKADNILFTQMYAMLKQSNPSVETQNFNWEIVRKKMIESIDANILNDQISAVNKERWRIIKKQLNDDATNIANLFEQYDELFLLLKEVHGLDALPNTITIITKTKIYPNLSADKLYAAIGKEAVYVFLREISNEDIRGSAIDKGAVKIKNTSAKSFIVGESLEFFLDEKFVNQNLYKKENINWIVRNIKNKNDKGIVFANEGTSFNYNFDTAGVYRIDAFGYKSTTNGNKSASTSTFVELEIITQQIDIKSPFKGSVTRATVKEQLFKVALKDTKVKIFNPLKLYYQFETKTASKTTKISEEQELDGSGIIKLAMPDLGEYKIKVFSKDQYSLTQESVISVIKNEITSIGLAAETSNNNVFLLGNPENIITLEVKTFKINPSTDEEKEDVKWMVYDSDNKPYLPSGDVLFTDNKDPKKTYLQKWSSFTMSIPQKVGCYTIEAFSDRQKGAKAECVFKMEVQQPKVTEACWAFKNGNKKTNSGFTGELNHIRALIPGYRNQSVRVELFLNDSEVVNYYNDTKTNENGEINKTIKFDNTLQKHMGIKNGENAKIRFELTGIKNGVLCPFKKNIEVYKDAVLRVSTSAKITDIYFKYEDNRVTPFTQVPYGGKLRGVVRTLNMVGKQVSLQVYRNVQDVKYTHKTIVNSEGVAVIDFVLDKKWHVLNPLLGIVDMFYLGMEGIASKLSLENGLNAVPAMETKKKNIANLTWGSKVTKEFREKVIEICSDLWPKNTMEMANGLMAVMYRETNRTFAANQMAGYKSLIDRNNMTRDSFNNFNKKSGTRSSRAVGLIQFTQAALVSMKEFENGKGFDELHRIKLAYANMTEIEQLDKVRKYFKNVARLPRVPEDIYVAVFSPDFVGRDGTDTLYKKGTDSYIANPGLDKNNDGIQKNELLVKYNESLQEGSQNVNMEGVSFEYEKVDINEKVNNNKRIHSNIVTFDNGLSEDRIKQVSNKTIKILESAANDSLNKSVIITSTIRNSLKQAQAMYNNESKGNHIRYKEPGRKVIRVYNTGVKAGKSKDEIIKLMNKKIIELSNLNERVSKHCVSDEIYRQFNIIDVSHKRGLVNKVDFIHSLADIDAVTKILHPLPNIKNTKKIIFDDGEDAIHIEIKQ